MNIRPVKREDLPICAALYADVFAAEPWNESWTKETAFQRLSHFFDSKGFTGLLVEDGELLAFALGNDEPFQGRHIFYLREMCTRTDRQGAGIGSALLQALEKTLRDSSINSIYLTTNGQIPAAGFYQSHGFAHHETMHFYMKRLAS